MTASPAISAVTSVTAISIASATVSASVSTTVVATSSASVIASLLHGTLYKQFNLFESQTDIVFSFDSIFILNHACQKMSDGNNVQIVL